MSVNNLEKSSSTVYDGRLSINQLLVGQATGSDPKSRFKGLPIGRDADGFYVYGRTRTGSHPTPQQIPHIEVKEVLKGMGINVDVEVPEEVLKTSNVEVLQPNDQELTKQNKQKAKHDQRRAIVENSKNKGN